MKQAFEPFDETQDPRHLSWKGEDHTDKFIPDTKGFITDFVYATRGREVASIYAVWGAIYMMSSVLQRDVAYVPTNGDPWTDKDYLNMYCLLIGPAGSGKSATITIIQKILTGCNIDFETSENPHLKRKHFTQISDVSTPEAFLGQMANHSMVRSSGEEEETKKQRKKYIGNVDGSQIELNAWSNANAMLSEFGALLKKKKYNDSMSTNLLTLYDSPEMFTWSTVKRGNVMMPDVYLNIIGASTADGMTSNVDPKILEDGFMSRVVMVSVKDYVRSRPERFKTDCSFGTIKKRLMWIAENKGGIYKLSKTANDWYHDWYNKFMAKMNTNPEKAGYMIRNRTLIIKLGALLKISEYTPGTEIEVRHLQMSEKLIRQTYHEVAELVGYFTDAQLGAARRAIEAALVGHKAGLTRQELAVRLSRFRDDAVNAALNTLYLRGQLKATDDSGKDKGAPDFFPKERYIYERIAIKYDDEDTDVYGDSKGPVSKRSPRNKNSKGNGSEPVGNIPNSPEVWGGHFPRDEGAEA